MEKIINYDWQTMIVRIVEGLKNFIAKVEHYFPKSSYGFEDPSAEWNQE